MHGLTLGPVLQVLEADPLDFECLTNLGKISYSKGDLVKARDLFERAVVVRPEREKTMYHLARVLFDLKVTIKVKWTPWSSSFPASACWFRAHLFRSMCLLILLHGWPRLVNLTGVSIPFRRSTTGPKYFLSRCVLPFRNCQPNHDPANFLEKLGVNGMLIATQIQRTRIKTQHVTCVVLVWQVVQGYKDEDIIGDACDQATYHNAIAMLGLIHHKVRGTLLMKLICPYQGSETPRCTIQVFNQVEKAEQLYKVVLRADPDHVLTLDHR